MIRIISYTHLLILVLSVGVLFGCNSDIVEQKRQAESRYIRINGYPKGFSEVEVSTRSGKNEFETKLSTLYMLIFDANGQLVDVPQFIASGVPDFLIDTHSPSFVNHDQQALRQCDIFLVGNLNNGDLAGIRSLTELYNFEVEATTIHPDADPSFKGLVMIGQTQEKVDLSLARPSTSNNIQDIFMVSIYAKVVVNLQIRPEEHLPGNDQSFRMISWEVVNAPRYATLGAPDATDETAPSHGDKIPSSPSGLYSGSNPVGVSQSLSYTFYMLEHKRNKLNTVNYPEGIDEMSKQRFKPKFVNEDTDAAYMIINGIYVDHQLVKRDYFTTNLISTLPKSYGPFTSDFRVWAYFDENTSTSDRIGKIIFTYVETATGDQTVLTYTFLQKGLFEVAYNGHTYYIEFHEEYLHNFDPNDPFNNKTDGMFWGLDGMQLSHRRDAFKYDGILSNSITNNIKSLLRELDPQFYLYDFYTPRDEATVGTNGVTINERAGHAFTSDIVATAGIGPLKLNEKAGSAVEYCYNKNKRNAAGIVSEIKWYLPAIDEIEDIVMGAYGTFTDFQNKYYWSSQPAYDYYTYHYRGLGGLNSGDGNFFNDNLYSARATKIDYQSSVYNTVKSGMSDYLIKFNFRRPSIFEAVTWGNPREEINPVTPVDDPGKQSRTNINRIRCVYRAN